MDYGLWIMRFQRRVAGVVSKCPFWSTTRDKVDCYKECPILGSEASELKEGEQCIFYECTELRNVNFRDIIKDDYSFMNLSIYDQVCGKNNKDQNISFNIF